MAIESNKANMPESFFICQLIKRCWQRRGFPWLLPGCFMDLFLWGDQSRANRGVEGRQQLLASGSLAR